MKYKVGEKVKLRSDLIKNQRYGEEFYVNGMASPGSIITIEIVFEKDKMYSVNGWKYTDEMIERSINNSNPIYVSDDVLEALNKLNINYTEIPAEDLNSDTTKDSEEDLEPFPQLGDKFYYITTDAEVRHTTQGFDPLRQYDQNRVEIGDAFRTQKEAEDALERLKINAIFKRYSSPFEFGENNYYVYLNENNELVIDYSIYYACPFYYFDSRETAKQVINMIGKQKIKEYLFNIKED